MSLHESGENYLETILLLQRRNGFVRAVDVANELGIPRRPSAAPCASCVKMGISSSRIPDRLH